jgi:hypothetical protein
LFAGGGFVFGSFETDAKACGEIQETIGLKVIDVGYRLCPGTVLSTFNLEYSILSALKGIRPPSIRHSIWDNWYLFLGLLGEFQKTRLI